MSGFPAPAFEGKICAPERLKERLAGLARPLVFTNGVFDIVHRGHVTCLARAAALGVSLVVALNTDESVRRLGKGSDRPINRLADRAAVLAALASCTLVTWFDSDTPLSLIEIVRPDTLVKGGDWAAHEIVGADLVQGYGGRVVSIPFEHQRSTTALLGKIRAS
jgi:rfaE bifunctional protein nucleotidyltransferase chain/domain